MSIADLTNWANVAAFTVRSTPVTWAELLGFITGALCVWLVARQHVVSWPIGIANNVFFLLLFWSAGLFADATLQIVYMALAAYGWWQWVFGGARVAEGRHAPLAVSRTSRQEWLVLAAAGVLATAALHLILQRYTTSTVPFWDALTTALSLLATYGQCRKRLESWWLWIAADVVYIPLYAYKGLWLTAVLYAVFLTLCVAGLVSWRADLRRRPVLAAAVA